MTVTREPLETHALTTPDGASLVVDHRPPPLAEGERPRGALWCSHALLANRRSLDRPRGEGLASVLASAGLHVYTFDMRGHGESRLPPGSAGWRYDEIHGQDLPTVTRFLRARHPDLPLAGLGHSLSAHGILAAEGHAQEERERRAARGEPQDASRPALDALVCIAGNVWLPSLEDDPWRWAKKLAILAGIGAAAEVAGRVPARALGAGSEDGSQAFAREWLRWALADRWASADGADHLASLARIRAPVLAVAGTGDTLFCRPAAAARFHAHLRRAPVTLLVAGPSETGWDPDHMGLVTDARSRPLWQRIASWLVETLAATKVASGEKGASPPQTAHAVGAADPRSGAA